VRKTETHPFLAIPSFSFPPFLLSSFPPPPCSLSSTLCLTCTQLGQLLHSQSWTLLSQVVMGSAAGRLAKLTVDIESSCLREAQPLAYGPGRKGIYVKLQTSSRIFQRAREPRRNTILTMPSAICMSIVPRRPLEDQRVPKPLLNDAQPSYMGLHGQRI
jgi:hypothetical protein